jgi:imidazolonepropionase-like amidohydrolase
MAARGGRVVKVALGRDGLDPALLPVEVAAARRHGVKVAAHALANDEALLAARAGCDLLAHTPVETLAEETVAAWRGRAVVSTLAAFRGSDSAVANLGRLHAGGVTVLYGTDLGNVNVAAVNPDELRLLSDAGLDPAEVTAAMTSTPAAYWGLVLGDDTYVRVPRDPAFNPQAYLEPLSVVIEGTRIR